MGSYALLVVSMILSSGMVVAGLFHIPNPGIIYFSSLGASIALLSFSMLLYLVKVFSYLRLQFSSKRGFVSISIDILADLRFAVLLMIVIGFLSMLGSTYVPQRQSIGFYIDRFGFEKGLWFWKLWISDVFSSWYYLGSIALLGLSLIACSYRRLPSVFKQAFAKVDLTNVKDRLRDKNVISIEKVSEQKLEEFLKTFGKHKKWQEGERTYFFAQKGRFSRLGVYVVHLGLLVVMAGGLIDGIFGFRGNILIPEGGRSSETALIPSGKVKELPLQIELKDFRIVSYGEEASKRSRVVSQAISDAIASFESDIVIFSQDGERASKVAVNKPVEVGQYRLFQATYSMLPEAGNVKLAIFDKSKASDPQNGYLGSVSLSAGSVSEFKDMLLAIDRSTLNLENEALGAQGILKPALMVKVVLNGETFDVPVIYSPELSFFAQSQMENSDKFPYLFFLTEFEPRFISGFQISYQPGVPLIWAGSFMIVFGMMLAFYTNHKKVFVMYEGDTLKLSLWSHKFKEEFHSEVLKYFSNK
ncbi:MAG: cytochrome c biogenesis protein ResB [Aquificaceae bacterium]